MTTALNKQMDALVREANGITEATRLEGRGRTAEEEHRMVDILGEMKRLRDSKAEVDGFMRGNGELEEISQTSIVGEGRLGDFVFSEGYKQIKNSSNRPQTWTSGAAPVQTKG